MILRGFVSSITIFFVFLSLCVYTNSAPAHHLTIGVQGNTPTLFVTSSEIGITSETERSRLKTSKVQKDYKLNEKSKYQKTKTNANYKKGKSPYFTKNIAATALPTDFSKLNQTQASAFGSLSGTNIYKDMSKTAQELVTTAPTEHTSLVSLLSSVASKETSVTTTGATVTDENLKQTRTGEAVLHEEVSPVTDESSTKSPTESAIETAATTTSTACPLTKISTDDARMTSEETVSKTVASTDVYDGTISPEAVSTTTTSIMHDEMHDVTKALKSSISTTLATPDLESTDRATTHLLSTSTATESNSATETQTENLMETEAHTSISPEAETTMVQMLATDSKFLPSTTESILKLIDLERHNTKNFESFGQQGVAHDSGHDGLKNIKKKQLVDRHFLEESLHVKPEEAHREAFSTDIPVKHGFLGPILMEEKTFHVVHALSSELNKTYSGASLDSQLRHSNFIEIKPTTDERQSTTSTTTTYATTVPDVALHSNEGENEETTVLSSTTFEVVETPASKTSQKPSTPLTTSTASVSLETASHEDGYKSESKISDIQIEVYDSTIDSIVASTNFKDTPQGKTTKPPASAVQQERFTQYVIDRTETSTQESINYSTIQVASGMPEPAAIEIHINVSESFSNDSDDLDVSFPQSDYSNTGRSEDAYDDVKIKDDIKLKVPSNTATSINKDRSDEILVVEVVDSGDNATMSKTKVKPPNEMILSDVRVSYSTPPPPPPPPPYQGSFDRDSDTIFYISNTEVKVGESPPTVNKALDERKMKLENQFFPANYMASTHPNVNPADDHHLYEEDIILSSDRNQADSLKIYRNRNEPSPPLDVTYVGESIIEVEQSPDSSMTTTLSPDHVITPQPDVIIQPAILPEISIGVPVIGELPPQIELKEIDFMPNEGQLHHSGLYGSEDSNGVSGSNKVDNRLDDSSIQYGGDLIDESADGGFDGVEGSYPFGNPASLAQRKGDHVADYAHLYINYGVNSMRKDELSADIKDSGEVNVIVSNSAGSVIEQNATSKEFMNRVALNNLSSSNDSERISNVTAFSIMEDPSELDEKNTEDIINLISLAIGLFIVILPVVVTCSMLWALRYLYKKYHSTSTDNNGNLDPTDAKGLPSEDAAEKGECEQKPCSPSRSDKDDIQKCPETFKEPSIDISIVKFSADHPTTPVNSSVALHCKMYSCSSKPRDCPLLMHPNPTAGETQTVHDEILPGPNGSVTKMTLENNLLIVETEERNDISRVARETKMDYNKDGVFVVEVARGIDSRTIPESPVTEGPEKMLSMFEPKHNGNMGYKLANEKVSHNNEKVQIHSPPPEKTDDGPRSLHQIEEVEEPTHSPRLDGAEEETVLLNYKSNTGLSQSDLSSTSSNDSNKDYCYGNQELYVVEQSGYSTSSPTANVAVKCDTKDIKDDDQNSENGPYLEHSPHKEEDAREADDILDTINKQSKTDTFDKSHVVEGEKEAEDDAEKVMGEMIVNNNEEKVMCNGHLESNGSIIEESESAAENCDSSNFTNSNAVSEDSEKESEDLLNPAETNHLSTNGPQDDTIIMESKSTEVAAEDLKLENDMSTIDDDSTIPCTENEKSNPKSLAIVSEETLEQTEDLSPTAVESQLHLNGTQETPPDDEQLCSEKTARFANETPKKSINQEEVLTITKTPNNSVDNSSVDIEGSNETSNALSSHLTNGSHILPDVVLSGKVPHLTNGDVNCEVSSIYTTEFENGYDSIMSLPDPPTNDDILCGDLSEHQMDSLPPPPPPMLNELNGETFNLKDLPPPLVNGETECLTNEDSTNYYASLPPPPQTTLEVSASAPTTNGNMHASPLTPPASPPPHFTNGLHATMCPPIAVDVNGS